MYNNFNFNNNDSRPLGAFEIERRARELEKQFALMNYLKNSQQPSGLAEVLGKATRRIGSLIGSLFL